jgi:pimeloyl-ACP methyl ester carboxylesterase
MKEEILLFGKTKSLVGIVTGAVADSAYRPGIILLNAGLIHRAGPNRLYVAIARKLAAMGFVVLRFDFSGTGDSRPREDHLPIDQSGLNEVQEAMNILTQSKGIEQFLLIGHCSGAGFSFKVASEDPRVVGAVFINPQGSGEEWVAYDRDRKQAQYYTNYYSQALFSDPQKLKRFITGDVNYRNIARNVFENVIRGKISAMMFRASRHKKRVEPLLNQEFNPTQELRSMVERGVQLLFVYSEGNSGLEYVRNLFGQEFDRLLAAKKLKLEIIPESDHLFTLVAGQKRLLNVIDNWTTQAWPSSYQEPLSAPYNKR